MEFCRWYPLAEAGDHTPEGPGVLQVRVATGLIDYPRGKSAMVLYAHADALRAAARALATAHAGKDLWCRHLEGVDPGVDLATFCEKLRSEFERRFGAPLSMKLVEPEAEGPIEGEEPIVTPPRPPHRRVSVSFLFTLTVLVGTVVAIYVIFPARHNLLLTEAIEAHQEANPSWDLVAPPFNEMRTWAIGVTDKDVPLPPAGAKILAARQTNIHDRRAAIVRFTLGGDELTYLVQHGRGIPPKRRERSDGDVHAVSWKAGKFTCVVAGPSATKDTWVPLVSAKK